MTVQKKGKFVKMEDVLMNRKKKNVQKQAKLFF